MISTISENQYTQIESFLMEEGMDYLPLREELLDHICCSIEYQMQQGNSFENAFEQAIDHFEEKELKSIQKETFHLLNHKNRIMKIIALSALALLMYFPTLNWMQQLEPPSIHPLGIDYAVNSGFGMRKHPISKELKMHKGVDFKAPIGTPVKATGDGIVKNVKQHTTGYGNHIIIDHGDGYETVYAQLSMTQVKEGQRINKGEKIGEVGSSGASTGPHLHYEVRKNGQNENPADYF